MSTLLNSILEVETIRDPWTYFVLQGALTNEQIVEIERANVTREGYIHDGTRSGINAGGTNVNNPFREYVTRSNAKEYPALVQLIEDLRRPDIRQYISELIGRPDHFKDAYIRLEILCDYPGFWLEPHCDIPEKLISSLIYVNTTGEDESLGTDLYDTSLTKITTIPFKHNYGYMFAGPDKWHGLGPGKTIKVARRGVQLNYVTFPTDWRV